MWGDVLCLASTFLYACYTVVIRVQLPDDEDASMVRTPRSRRDVPSAPGLRVLTDGTG